MHGIRRHDGFWDTEIVWVLCWDHYLFGTHACCRSRFARFVPVRHTSKALPRTPLQWCTKRSQTESCGCFCLDRYSYLSHAFLHKVCERLLRQALASSGTASLTWIITTSHPQMWLTLLRHWHLMFHHCFNSRTTISGVNV